MKTLDHQIESCRKLLQMFQEERQSYAEKQSVEIHDVLESMKQKQQMVEVFATQEELSKTPPKDDNERKQLRVLGQLLEQLLVIEQENEIMLSRLVKNSERQDKKSGSSLVKNRPALQQQLPFMPNSQPQEPVNRPLAPRTSSLKRASKYI